MEVGEAGVEECHGFVALAPTDEDPSFPSRFFEN